MPLRSGKTRRSETMKALKPGDVVYIPRIDAIGVIWTGHVWDGLIWVQMCDDTGDLTPIYTTRVAHKHFSVCELVKIGEL